MRSSKNFKEEEFNCKCSMCGMKVPHSMQPEVINAVQMLRDALGRPLTITSGYRCAIHPSEAKKSTPGQHNKGLAVDIRASNGAEAFELIRAGLSLGANGFAYGNGFIHLDWRESTPVTWRY